MYSLKPGRGPSFMGGVSGLIMAAFGICWTIFVYALTRDAPFPLVGTIFPLFGVIFVIAGISMAIYNFVNASSKNRFSKLDITVDQEEPDPLNLRFGEPSKSSETIEARLGKLDNLKKQGLISDAEYTAQRNRVLSDL